MAVAQLEMFAQNIALLIGILLCGGASIVILTAIYVAVRVAVFRARQRRSMEEYYRRTRRADGKMYPPIHPGFCDQCGRSGKSIYHLNSGERLCAPCYEDFWRQAECGEIRDPEGSTAAPGRPATGKSPSQ